MSTENAGQASVNSASEKPAQQPACCCSCKKWVVLLVILVVLAGGGWVAYGEIGAKLRATDAYRIALDKIRKDSTVKNEIGAPINDSWRTAGRADANEADLLFTVSGFLNWAKVHAHAKPIQGKWELDTLDVTVAGSGRVLHLMNEEEGGAPPFEASKTTETPSPDAAAAPAGDAKPADAAKPQENAPSPEINMEVPKK
jgi:hypothetical protein